jgi:hypothetical protein
METPKKSVALTPIEPERIVSFPAAEHRFTMGCDIFRSWVALVR